MLQCEAKREMVAEEIKSLENQQDFITLDNLERKQVFKKTAHTHNFIYMQGD